jgi:bifunctional UDP-N-acetylglucosamine pyrophosphorylase / glucosamine-1-phosphate N-acetyltransferase
MKTKPHILILAAGQGKRMNSQTPKVLHPILFRPMIHHLMETVTSLPFQSVSLIVGHGEKELRASLKDFPNLQYFTQKEQLGTAHAVRMADDFLASQSGSLLVLSGDVVLMPPEFLKSLIDYHGEQGASCTIATAIVDNPKGYGRILRGEKGEVVDIREQVDCSAAENEIHEVNSGVYCFELSELREALGKINNRNLQKEYYLPDVIRVLVGEGRKVLTVPLADPRDMMGINDRYCLSQVESLLQARTNQRFMMNGVSMMNPASTFIDPRCKIATDVTIEPDCFLIRSVIESNVVIEAGCRIIDSHVGTGSHLKQGCVIEKSQIGAQCAIGPFAHLRPESQLRSNVKIGNFVEIKKSTIGKGSKASHLSYIGDAEVGEDVNLGCGFITCNYDGAEKHVTVIENDVFVGSDSQTVAPVRIGRGSYVASGSTITEDVPADSLALSRGRQVTKSGYGKKYPRPKK